MYLTCTMYVLSANIKKSIFFSNEFLIFTAEENLCILHGQVLRNVCYFRLY